MTLRTVFKYGLKLEDHQHITMPKKAEILTVQVQHGLPCIWAIIDTDDQDFHQRHIRCAGTGHPLDEWCNWFTYLGTIQLQNGLLIFHFFEENSP